MRAAALASDPAGQDPVDGAIIKAATDRGWQDGEMERIDFKPFDPATKRAEAVYREGTRLTALCEGRPAVVAKLAGAAGTCLATSGRTIVGRGQRVLGVAEEMTRVALRGSAGA